MLTVESPILLTATRDTESALADQIGSLVHDNAAITRDMESLLTDEMCRKGMLAYIDAYQGGVLRQLAK